MRPAQYFPLQGGAVFVGQNGRFSANRTQMTGTFNADTGGIVYADSGSRVVLQECALSAGRAISSGGGLWAGPKSTVVLIDSSVSGCLAQLGSGGAAYLSAQAKLLALATPLGGCAFSGNAAASATGSGGAVFAAKQATVWLAGCDLLRNSAQRGGAVFVSGGDAKNNYALARNGLNPFPQGLLASLAQDPAWAAFATPRALSTLGLIPGYTADNVLVNTASVIGMAALVQWELFAEECTFALNAAGDGGGSVFCEANSHCGVRAGEVVASRAGASGGGVLSAVGAADLLLDSVAVVNCSAGEVGGGVSVEAARASFLSCAFEGSTAAIGGGAVYSSGAGGAVNAFSCSFTNNTAAGLYPKGGSLYVSEGVAWRLADCAFEGNAVVELRLQDTQRSRRVVVEPEGALQGGAAFLRAAAGGAAAASAPVAFDATRCRFASNAAPLGGALATFGAVALSAAASNFTENVGAGPEGRGGALYAMAREPAALSGCLFWGNRADAGAALFTNDTSAGAAQLVSSNAFEANEAANFGPILGAPLAAWLVAAAPSPPAALNASDPGSRAFLQGVFSSLLGLRASASAGGGGAVTVGGFAAGAGPLGAPDAPLAVRAGSQFATAVILADAFQQQARREAFPRDLLRGSLAAANLACDESPPLQQI